MNYLKANPEKSQLLITSKDTASIKIDGTDIKGSSKNILLIVNSLLTNMVLSFAKQQVINYKLWIGFQNI